MDSLKTTSEKINNYFADPSLEYWRGALVGALLGAPGAAMFAHSQYKNLPRTPFLSFGKRKGVIARDLIYGALVGALVGAGIPAYEKHKKSTLKNLGFNKEEK